MARELLKNKHHVIALNDLSMGRMENVAHLKTNPDFELVTTNIKGSETVLEMAYRYNKKILFLGLANKPGVSSMLKMR